MNPKELIEDYKRKTHLKGYDGEYYLLLPLFRPGESDSVQIKMYEQDGESYVSDCGGTFLYLKDRGVDPEKYRERIDRIKHRFYTEEKDGELILCFPSPSPENAEIFLGYFFQAVLAIGCIDA